MNNENKHLKLHIDEAIEHRNKNMHGELTRMELGRMIFPEQSEGSIKNIMINWNQGKLVPKPELWELKHMATICGVSIDFLMGVTDMPEPYPNIPARMLTILLLCEQELQLHRNLDESVALREIQTIKTKLV